MSSSVFPAVKPEAAGAVAEERIADVITEATELLEGALQAMGALRRGEHDLALQLLETARKPAGMAGPRVAWAQTAVSDAKAVARG